jgi:hypothetical protein
LKGKKKHVIIVISVLFRDASAINCVDETTKLIVSILERGWTGHSNDPWKDLTRPCLLQ